MRRFAGLALLVVLGCSGQSSTTASSSSKTDAQAEEPATRCESDGDCLLSCIQPNDCCGGPVHCTEARHYDDHAKIEATRSNCANFDYTKCPAQDYSASDWVYLPVCKRGRCQAKQVERQPPPPPIDLSGYDRTCKTDADCVLVQPYPCSKCGCASEPIAAREQQRFQDAIAAVKCQPYDIAWDIECGACMESTPWCDAGQCKAKPQ